jgi:hypothetical protein
VTNIAKSLIRRRGALAALVAASLVAAMIIVQLIALAAVAGLGPVSSASGGTIPGAVEYFVRDFVAMCVGIFLSLWVIAPIAPELHIGHVITRSSLAAGVGGVAALIVRVAIGLVSLATVGHGIAGAQSSGIYFDAGSIGIMATASVVAAVTAFIVAIPFTVLAGVLVWNWLQRHPSRHAVSGMLDEV